MLQYISRISFLRTIFFYNSLHTNCFYIVLCTELWLWISTDSQIRRFPRNQFLTAQYVGTRWRIPPQRLVAISSAARASSKPSRFRRNVQRAGRAWEQIVSIGFTFQALLVKVKSFTYRWLVLPLFQIIDHFNFSYAMQQYIHYLQIHTGNIMYLEKPKWSRRGSDFGVNRWTSSSPNTGPLAVKETSGTIRLGNKLLVL